MDEMDSFRVYFNINNIYKLEVFNKYNMVNTYNELANKIKQAPNKRVLIFYKRQAKDYRDSFSDPNIKPSVRKKVNMQYRNLLKLIQKRKKQLK